MYFVHSSKRILQLRKLTTSFTNAIISEQTVKINCLPTLKMFPNKTCLLYTSYSTRVERERLCGDRNQLNEFSTMFFFFVQLKTSFVFLLCDEATIFALPFVSYPNQAFISLFNPILFPRIVRLNHGANLTMH